MSDLRDMAVNSRTWVAFKMRDMGATEVSEMPEAIRKLDALAALVIVRAEMPADNSHLVANLRSEINAARERLTIARKALYSIAGIVEQTDAALDGSPMADEMAVTYSVSEELDSDTFDSLPVPTALSHGLVLVNRKGERLLYSETRNGQFCAQAIAPDGVTAGEPWSSVGDIAAIASEWRVGGPVETKPLPRYNEAVTKPSKPVSAPPTSAASRTEPLPGMADVAPSLPMISEYVPSEAKVSEWATKIGCSEERVRELVTRWKTDPARASKRQPDPTLALSYWILRPENQKD